MSYQLSKYIKIKGKDAPWNQHEIAEMLMHISEDIYENDEDNNPYDGHNMLDVGFTGAAIKQLCIELNVPIHIKWHNKKTDSFTPIKSEYESIAIYIWGDHVYCVGDEKITKAICRESISLPTPPNNEVLATINHRMPSTPASQYWSTYSYIQPGHFKCDNLVDIRTELLKQGICPQVKLSGTGIIKGLNVRM